VRSRILKDHRPLDREGGEDGKWKRADGRGSAAIAVLRALDADPRGIQRGGRPVHVPPEPPRTAEDLAASLPLSLSVFFSRSPDSCRGMRLRTRSIPSVPAGTPDAAPRFRPRVARVKTQVSLAGNPSLESFFFSNRGRLQSQAEKLRESVLSVCRSREISGHVSRAVTSLSLPERIKRLIKERLESGSVSSAASISGFSSLALTATWTLFGNEPISRSILVKELHSLQLYQ